MLIKTMPRHAASCRAMPSLALPCHAEPCQAVPRLAQPRLAMPSLAQPYHAMLNFPRKLFNRFRGKSPFNSFKSIIFPQLLNKYFTKNNSNTHK
jgi:hypothetical protein